MIPEQVGRTMEFILEHQAQVTVQMEQMTRQPPTQVPQRRKLEPEDAEGRLPCQEFFSTPS